MEQVEWEAWSKAKQDYSGYKSQNNFKNEIKKCQNNVLLKIKQHFLSFNEPELINFGNWKENLKATRKTWNQMTIAQ